jgi:exodeoxyribonuclease VII large subunit
VISAVGHEVDVTIADFVADLRAPTPSAAAELVVREKQAVADAVRDLRARLDRAVTRRIDRERSRLATLAERRVLTDPARALREHQRRVDEAAARLSRAMRNRLRDAAHRIELATTSLGRSSPRARLVRDRHQLEQLGTRLRADMARALERRRHQVGAAVGRLDSLSPLAVLGRGYSLTRLASGEIVKASTQAPAGTRVEILLGTGSLECRVEQSKERDERPQV